MWRKLLLVLAGVVAIGAVGVWVSVNWFIHEQHKLFAKTYQRGELESAYDCVEHWLELRANDAEGWFWKARICLALRKPIEAQEAIQKAESLGFDRERLKILDAIARGQAGRFQEAEPILRDAFNANQEHDPLISETLAKIYLESYDLVRAHSAITRWIKEAPHDAKPYLWRTEIDTRKGDRTQLVEDYRAAIARDPKLAAAYLGLAEELRNNHLSEDAAEPYVTYLKLKPDDGKGYLGAGRNAIERGRVAEAEKLFEKATSLAPNDPNAYRLLSDILSRRGDTLSALGYLDRALDIDPYDLETTHRRGLLLRQLGRNDEAVVAQSKAAQLRVQLDELMKAQASVAKSPNDLDAQLSIMRWMFSHGKSIEGIRWGEQILRLRAGHPEACRLLPIIMPRRAILALRTVTEPRLAMTSNPMPRID